MIRSSVAALALLAFVGVATLAPTRSTASPVVAPSPAPTAAMSAEISLVPTVDIVTLAAAKDAYHGLATQNLDKKSLAPGSVGAFSSSVVAHDAAVLTNAGAPTAFVLVGVQTNDTTTTYAFRVETTGSPVMYRYTIDTSGKDSRRIVGLSVAPTT